MEKEGIKECEYEHEHAKMMQTEATHIRLDASTDMLFFRVFYINKFGWTNTMTTFKLSPCWYKCRHIILLQWDKSKISWRPGPVKNDATTQLSVLLKESQEGKRLKENREN